MNIKKMTIAATTAIALTFMTGAFAPASQASVSVSGGVSFDFFYSNLSPSGHWLVSAGYGRVWQPAIYQPGWNPYYDGHWEYTDCGWVWVSDYDWGAVPYHYGTWVMDPVVGWAWVPGYTWAPAWVTFRTGPDFIGWAPVAPGFSVGVSFGAPVPIASSFVFVSAQDFAAPHIRRFVAPESQRATLINRTTIVNNSLTVQNNVIVNRGPELRAVEQATGRTFRPEPIERVARVAPFEAVRRDQLAVAAAQRHEVRAAEPVSANRPLPRGEERASAQQFGHERPADRRPEMQPQERHQEPRNEPRSQPSERQQMQQQERPQHQHAEKARPDDKAAAPPRPEKHAPPPPAMGPAKAQPRPEHAAPQQQRPQPQQQAPTKQPQKKNEGKKPPQNDEKHGGGGGGGRGRARA